MGSSTYTGLGWLNYHKQFRMQNGSTFPNKIKTIGKWCRFRWLVVFVLHLSRLIKLYGKPYPIFLSTIWSKLTHDDTYVMKYVQHPLAIVCVHFTKYVSIFSEKILLSYITIRSACLSTFSIFFKTIKYVSIVCIGRWRRRRLSRWKPPLNKCHWTHFYPTTPRPY